MFIRSRSDWCLRSLLAPAPSRRARRAWLAAMWGAATAALTAAFYVLLLQTRLPCGVDGTYCAPRACHRVRTHLAAHLHGQDTAAHLLADAVCDHVENPNPTKPLVASLHGSPGVGKSYFHQLLAQALYDAVDDDDHDDRARDAGFATSRLRDAHPDANADASATVHGRADDARSSPPRDALGRLGAWSRAASDAASTLARDASSALAAAVSTRDAASRPGRLRRCPGADCPAYKIIFGTDYVTSEREVQARRLRDALLDHLARFPESVVVVEEYDKMSCPARGMLKQLLDKGSHANATFHRAVFVMEANVGFTQIKRKLDERQGKRAHEEEEKKSDEATSSSSSSSSSSLTAEETTATQRALRDLMFQRWSDDGCEERSDTLKAVGAVDLFAPFVPLDRTAVARVVASHLAARRAAKVSSGEFADLTWTEDVVAFLTGHVEFEGKYAIEGGKEAPAALSRWVTRALRALATETAGGWGSSAEGALRDAKVELRVREGGRGLVARVVGRVGDRGET